MSLQTARALAGGQVGAPRNDEGTRNDQNGATCAQWRGGTHTGGMRDEARSEGGVFPTTVPDGCYLAPFGTQSLDGNGG